jgi:TetR/AcrR family transcriptional regulator, mexJK operon transcriptional repressor
MDPFDSTSYLMRAKLRSTRSPFLERSASRAAPKRLSDVTAHLAPAKSARGQRRREAILDAATAEFLAKGYQGASLRTMMAAAGGSSRTLYRHFGDKAGLFRAVVARLGRRATKGVVPDGHSDRPIATELFEIGVANISSLLEPQHLAFFRLMVAESATPADLPMLVWNATHNLVVAQLADYLRVKARRVGLQIADPCLAALQFVEASKSALHLEALFSGRHPPADELRRRVRAAVKTFLHGACRKAAGG